MKMLPGQRVLALGLTGLLLALAPGLRAAGERWSGEWPQWRGPARDGVWKETDVTTSLPDGQMPLLWKAAVSGGYSGPTAADGRVYVMDRVLEPAERERIHCFDAETGKELWKHEYPVSYAGISYPDGPRGSVSISAGRAFALGGTGMAHGLDAATGRVLWARDLRAEYKIRMPDWGIAGSPLVDGDRLVMQIGGENACLVALDTATGKEKWKSLPDRASYSAPILIEQGDRRVVLCLTGDRIVGVDAATGELIWSEPFPPKRWVIGIATPVVSGNRLFISTAGEGSHLYELTADPPGVKKLWGRVGQNERSTDALQVVMSTPVIQGDYVYGVDYYGEFRCLRLSDGSRVWEQEIVPKARWASAHLVQQGDRTWILNEKGDLIVGRLSPEGFKELDRTHLLDPTMGQLPERGGVVWSHPAFAYGRVYARNDSELVCASLRAP